MCTAAWEREESELFYCVGCDVPCELDNYEPFCSIECRTAYYDQFHTAAHGEEEVAPF